MLSIPFDPALVLGNIVDETLLNAVLAVSAAGAPADSAQEELNALILGKRSLDMTIQELTGMGIDPTPVLRASVDLGKEVSDAAVKYAQAMIKSQHDIIKAKGARAAVPVSKSVESPLDYTKSNLKGMPLSADTFKMDAQYFNNDQNQEGEQSSASSVSAYVSASVGFLGTKYTASATAAVNSQMHQQYSKHSIAGTLVITAGATHKQAQVFAPLIIDPDKAIRVWNQTFPQDRLNVFNPGSMASAITKEDDKFTIKLLSGATYGSSFVGMVHILNVSTTQSSESLFSVAASCQAQVSVASWYSANFGGGAASSFTNNIKNLLSSQQIQSHCSLVTTGIIPTIKSSEGPKAAVMFLKHDDPMKGVIALQTATNGAQNSVASQADQAKTGKQVDTMKAGSVAAAIDPLITADYANNRQIDVNSLITSFDDYVTRCVAAGDNFGVPINYYLKTMTKGQIALLWIAKYYPEYIAFGENDQVKEQTKAG